MVKEFYCLYCSSSDKIKLDIRSSDYDNDDKEAWLMCECGHEQLLGCDGDKV